MHHADSDSWRSAFLGDRVGEVVAETEVGVNDYLELPEFFFGHGPTGVIDRGRQVGRTVIEYVDDSGAPLDPIDEFPIPAFADTDGDGIRDNAAGLIEVLDSDLSWQLDIQRDPSECRLIRRADVPGSDHGRTRHLLRTDRRRPHPR